MESLSLSSEIAFFTNSLIKHFWKKALSVLFAKNVEMLETYREFFSNGLFICSLGFWWTFYESASPLAILINLSETEAKSNQFVLCTIKCTIHWTTDCYWLRTAYRRDLSSSVS